jgi:hypothetical protein
MKTFFACLLSLIALPLVHSGEGDPAEWWAGVTEELACTVKAEEGDAELRVELRQPDEEKLQPVKDADGTLTGYLFEGKRMPEGFWPGRSLIKAFEVRWGGKKIEIPERFWADLAGFRIQKSPLDPSKLPEDQQSEARQFLERLDRPRVIISADGGTLLIEWERGEECDGHSTIRWIISKSGTILRHRHTPPHEC